ncbi:MAG: transposase [Planctomycetota bacterium]
MRTSKFSESRIMSILKQQEAGVKVAEVCREHGISAATFHKWRSKYGGLYASMLKRVKELEAESARPKKMYAESQLESAAMKEALAKKW